MGLDIAEFVIAVEEAFQIDIMESDAQNIDTLDDLVDYLCPVRCSIQSQS